MRRRILTAILSVSAIAVVLFGVPLAILAERFVDEEATLRLERQAILAARDVPADFTITDDPVELPEDADQTVFSLYDERGRLVTGTGPPSADTVTSAALRNRVTDSESAGSRVVAVPISADEQVVGAIRAQQSTAESDARARRVVGLLGGLGLGVLAVGAAIGYLVAGRLARPVGRLRDAAVRLGEGDFTVEVEASGVPELDQAAEAMTGTAARLDALLTRERSFSADASHQLRTPLAGLRAAIETELEFPRDDHTSALEEALGDVDRLERTITDLLQLARTAGAARSTADVGPVLADLERDWRGPLAESGRPLRVAGDDASPLHVRGSAAALRQVLGILVDNASRHGRGPVRVDWRRAGENVTISVSDEGDGFPPSFDRGGSASGVGGELHGLGLPLAARLVEAMPGRLVISRRGPRPQIDIVLTMAEPQS